MHVNKQTILKRIAHAVLVFGTSDILNTHFAKEIQWAAIVQLEVLANANSSFHLDKLSLLLLTITTNQIAAAGIILKVVFKSKVVCAVSHQISLFGKLLLKHVQLIKYHHTQNASIKTHQKSAILLLKLAPLQLSTPI